MIINYRLKNIIANHVKDALIEDNVKKGLLFSDSLERHPGIFSNLYISLVRAGEVSGKLSETLDELSEIKKNTSFLISTAVYVGNTRLIDNILVK